MTDKDFEELGLRYSCDSQHGYRRRRHGKGFVYLNHKGERLRDAKTLERIKLLVIPPNWKNVWICPSHKGYLQATGFDEKGRKQYLYHAQWTSHRQQTKFSRMVEFGHSLPAIRRKIRRHLKIEEYSRQKVLALVVTILDQYYIRIGNKHYRDANKTFGLTTLRRKHLRETGNFLNLRYQAKSGKERRIKIDSPQLVRMIMECSALPGYELFRYRVNSHETHSIDSAEVNNYIREISGKSFTAKDFRTWGGTDLAIRNFAAAQKEIEENPRRKLSTALIKRVSTELGNTVSVCRQYYIHPAVLEVLLAGRLEEYKKTRPRIATLSWSEETVLNILTQKQEELQSI